MLNKIINNKFDEKSFKEYISSLGLNLSNDSLFTQIDENLEYKKIVQTHKLKQKKIIEVFILKSSLPIDKAKVKFNKILEKITKQNSIDLALMATYYEKDPSVWKFSLVAIDNDNILTNSKRYTFELGKNIPINTAKKQLRELNENSKLKDYLEAFSVEPVSNTFFNDYEKLFKTLTNYLKNEYDYLFKEDEDIRSFAKNILGRIVFLYFLQKKGWLGVKENWGDGDKNFFNNIFEKNQDKNFYEEILKPIFFEALNTKRENDYFKLLDCRIPFLNGGLFEKKEFDNEALYIDNSIFKEIFEVFSSYNFTIEEDTNNDKMVAIDPEMLGKIFESLLEENYQKSKGAFYTKREIVYFMCKNSLLEYLSNFFENEKMKELIFNHKTDDEYIIKNGSLILDKLQNIKVLDPAIGSGAFPMGMLLEIIEIIYNLNKTLQNKDIAIIKRKIIENCIYGIDIDKSAVDIAKLRFWISLIVDEDIPLPLPNLHFKIMQGNSLIEKIGDFDIIPDDIYTYKEKTLFDNINDDFDKTLFEDLKENIHKFYNETNPQNKQKQKEKIKDDIKKLILTYIQKEEKKLKQAQKMIANGNKTTQKKEQEKLENSLNNIAKANKVINDIINNDFQTNELFLYKLFFGEVIQNGGFDVVIGNPPYIMEYENKEAFNGVHSSECYQGKADLWHMFVCKGIDLLKEKGILNYIAKNQWLTSSSASNMREKLYRDTEIKKIIDFGANMMFDNADVQTMILFSQKNFSNETHKIHFKKFEIQDIKTILKQLDKNEIDFIKKEIPKNYDKEKNLTFSNDIKEKILEKIENKSNFTFEKNKEIIQGLIGGPDKAFIIKKDELNQFTKKEKEFIKMLHTHTDRYYTPDSDKYIFYISKKNFEKKNIDDYPDIKKHFEPFKEALIKAKIKYKTPNKPYFYLHRERNENFFKEGEKLVWAKRTEGRKFTYTSDNLYGTANLFFIKTHRINLKYLTALLNSKLFYFYMKERLKHTGDLLQIDKNQFLKIPIYKLEEKEVIKSFEKLVDKIIKLKKENKSTEELEKQIDELVYKLYKLTPEDIEIIENRSNK